MIEMESAGDNILRSATTSELVCVVIPDLGRNFVEEALKSHFDQCLVFFLVGHWI